MKAPPAHPADSRSPFWAVLYIGAGLALVAYTIARAARVPFTHDESLTFLNAVAQPIGRVVGLAFRDPNNHALNTWSMYLADRLFGPSEIALRSPNLTAHALYLVSSAFLARRIAPRASGFAVFALLNLNPFLLEFFSLARGYGLALGFVMASISVALEAILSEGPLRALSLGCVSLALASLAVLSNYALGFFYLSLGPVLAAAFLLSAWRVASNAEQPSILVHRRSLALGLAAAFLWNGLLLGLSAGRELIYLRGSGLLYVGGTSLWHDTLLSLIRDSLPGLPWIGPAVQGTVVVVLLLGAWSLFRIILLRRLSLDRIGWAALGSLLPGWAAIMLLAANLLEVNVVEGRSALFLVPLFGAMTGFVLLEVQRLFPRARSVGPVFLLIILVVALPNLGLSANLSTTTVWHYDADTRDMLADLAAEVSAGPSRPVRLGIDWWFEPTINFYRVTRPLAWLEPATRAGPEGEYDYYYLTPASLSQITGCQLAPIRTYPETGNVLARCAISP